MLIKSLVFLFFLYMYFTLQTNVATFHSLLLFWCLTKMLLFNACFPILIVKNPGSVYTGTFLYPSLHLPSCICVAVNTAKHNNNKIDCITLDPDLDPDPDPNWAKILVWIRIQIQCIWIHNTALK